MKHHFYNTQILFDVIVNMCIVVVHGQNMHFKNTQPIEVILVEDARKYNFQRISIQNICEWIFIFLYCIHEKGSAEFIFNRFILINAIAICF